MTALRSQSAMEYLMTYGWAMLIVAIVLFSLYTLGFFGPRTIANTCLADEGYLCSGAVFSTNTLNLYSDPSVTLNIGITPTYNAWGNVYVIVVPQGQVVTDISVSDEGLPNDFWYWGSLYGQFGFVSYMQQGQPYSVQIYINPTAFPGMGAKPALGVELKGSVYAMYTTSMTTNAVVQIGTFNVAATH